MQPNSLRSLIVIVVLLVGLAAVYLPDLLETQAAPLNASENEGYRYVADLDFWQRTPRETVVEATARFDLDADLNNVPLTVGRWIGEDVPETNQEVMILLEPEQYIRRLYHDGEGRFIWLSMIGGRSSRPFHAPDICYDADGWQYNLGSHGVALEGGGELYGFWLEAEKDFPDREEPVEHVVYYFYLFPDDKREMGDGIVLFKLTSERYGTPEETLAMQAEFVRELFVRAE